MWYFKFYFIKLCSTCVSHFKVFFRKLIRISAVFFAGFLLLSVFGQKESKENEKVGWTNRRYIQNKSVCTADKSICPNCQVWLLGESWYLSFIPPTVRVWHKAFFRWVQAQGLSRDMPGSSKNASGPVGIPLKRGTSSTRQ